MSCMLINDKTISALLQAVFNAGYSKREAVNPWQYQNDESAYHYVMFALEESQNQANLLKAANVQSYNACYKHNPAMQQPPFTGDVELSIGAPPHGPLQALKLVLFIEYQCCEVEGWASSEACILLNKYKTILISELPGYDRMAWGF